jgi:hypothetical protein
MACFSESLLDLVTLRTWDQDAIGMRHAPRHPAVDDRVPSPACSLEELRCIRIGVVQVEDCNQDMPLTKRRDRVPAVSTRYDEAPTNGVDLCIFIHRSNMRSDEVRDLVRKVRIQS